MARTWLKRPALLTIPALLASLLGTLPSPASAAELAPQPTFASGTSAELTAETVAARAKNGWAYDMVRADEAHAMGYTGAGLQVAILDNGIDPRATGITSKVVDSYNAIYAVNGQQEHGTATAGIVAAETNTEAGIGGVAPGVEILNVKVCIQSNCRDEGINPGLRWAIDHGADVISMSLGGSGTNAATHLLIREAIEKGIIVVAAAGNSACLGGIWQGPNGPMNRNCTQASLSKGYPSFYPEAGLISVAALERDGKRANYSTYNAQVDVAAPGSGVSTTFPWGPFSDFGGTSAATPVVAGVVALVKQAAPSLTPAQIQAVLQMTAVAAEPNKPEVWDSCTWDVPTSAFICENLSPARWPDRYFVGAGRVDAVAAIEAAKALEQKLAGGGLTEPTVTLGDAQLEIDWSNSGLGAGPYEVLVDGDRQTTTPDQHLTLTGLINEATYAITIRDSLGAETPPAMKIPTAQTPVAPETLTRISAGYSDTSIYFDNQQSTDGALVLSNGDVASCRANTCDYLVVEGDYTARLYAMGPLGYLSEASNSISFSSTKKPAPQNLKFENITATTIDISWDAVPDATVYEYYDAGAGQWIETAATSVSISGLNTALFSTFRVRAFNRDTWMQTLFTPTYWYFALPPELDQPSGLSVKFVNDFGATFAYTKPADAERIMFVRSDGKNQTQPADGPEIFDHYYQDDYGKTYTYRFVAIDDMRFGTQYGVISDPITVTVPYPRKNDRIDINGDRQNLIFNDERTFEAVTESKRVVDWTVSGSCQKVWADGNKVRVKATSGVGDCTVDANLGDDTGWFNAMERVTFGLQRKLDAITFSGMVGKLEFGKSVDITASADSGREVSWEVSEGCAKTSLGPNKIRIKATKGSGSCEIGASLGQTDNIQGIWFTKQQPLGLAAERITMVTTGKLLDRKPLVLSYKTLTGRAVTFKSSAMCSVKRLSSSKFEVSSKYTFGSCTITATIAVNSDTGAASSKLAVTLGRKPVFRQPDKLCD